MDEAKPGAQEIVIAFLMHADRFLVCRRERDPLLAGTWELPGGKVVPGEDRRAALEREVREETGFETEHGERVGALCHMYPDRRVVLHAYVCTLLPPSPPPSIAARAEVVLPSRRRGRWVTTDEYRMLPMPAANPPLLDALDWSRACHGAGTRRSAAPCDD